MTAGCLSSVPDDEPHKLVVDRAAASEHVSVGNMCVPMDAVFTFAYTSWDGAERREFSFPEDRLALALTDNPRVRRTLICDPPRSASRMLGRAIIRRSGSAFSFPDTAVQYKPIRFTRDDPVDLQRVRGAYRAYERGIKRAAMRHGLHRPAVITANPLLAGFGDFTWAGPVTYYAWDDWSAADPLRRWWPAYAQAYRSISASSRTVVAVSDAIIDKIAPTGRHAVVTNAVDPTEWAHLPAPPQWFASLPSPRLLYVGSLQSRIDVGQVVALAAAFPTGSISLVGPMQDPAHFDPLRSLGNVRLYPRVGQSEVRALMGCADVGLIPHVRSALTAAMSPLKLYEYLSAGLPVAAAALPGIVGVSDRVVTFDPSSDPVSAVTRALTLGRASETERLAFIAANSWARRFDTLLDLALADPPLGASDSRS